MFLQFLNTKCSRFYNKILFTKFAKLRFRIDFLWVHFVCLFFSFHGVFGRIKSISVIVPILVDEGLTLETSAFQIFHGGNSTFNNSFDKTKFLTLTILARFCAIEVGLSLTFVSSSRRIAESASVIVS